MDIRFAIMSVDLRDKQGIPSGARRATGCQGMNADLFRLTHSRKILYCLNIALSPELQCLWLNKPISFSLFPSELCNKKVDCRLFKS